MGKRAGSSGNVVLIDLSKCILFVWRTTDGEGDTCILVFFWVSE